MKTPFVQTAVWITVATASAMAADEPGTVRTKSIGSSTPSAIVGKDENGRFFAVLENSRIRVRYGFKMQEEPEAVITEFISKEFPEENIAGGLVDAAAHRGELIEAVVTRNDAQALTVSMAWNPVPSRQKQFPAPARSAVTIFPDEPFLRIDYRQYCFPHICDIGTPGGITGKASREKPDAICTYCIHGAADWQYLRRGIDNPALRNHENEHHRLTDELYPLYHFPLIDTDWVALDKNPLSYKGWYIFGLYNTQNRRGFGRLLPVDSVPYVKLLWNRGFEMFPYWKQPSRPLTSYLFVVTDGPDQILTLGKRIVDQHGGN